MVDPQVTTITLGRWKDGLSNIQQLYYTLYCCNISLCNARNVNCLLLLWHSNHTSPDYQLDMLPLHQRGQLPYTPITSPLLHFGLASHQWTGILPAAPYNARNVNTSLIKGFLHHVGLKPHISRLPVRHATLTPTRPVTLYTDYSLL